MRRPSPPPAAHPDAAVARDVLGALFGTAVGDALGLPAEGLPPARATRYARADRYRLVGRTGYVSDDTEQAALIADALIVGGDDPAIVRRFRRALGRWFLRLPFGIGLGTLRACLKNLLGWREPGVDSAGNGAAMRAPVIGLLVPDRARRLTLGRALARLTHTDPRAVDGALYAAELCAHAHHDRAHAVAAALEVVEDPRLADAIDRAVACAHDGFTDAEAITLLGTTGYVIHSLAWCTYVWLRAPDDAMHAIRRAIAGGGDTDTHAAIVGAWMGARHGVDALDPALVAALHDGPFGPSHLRALAAAVEGGSPPRFSAAAALLRNLMLYPVVLAHGVRRLWPL